MSTTHPIRASRVLPSSRPTKVTHQSARSDSTTAASVVDASALTGTTSAKRVLAVTRIVTGFIFLWAFLDKTFGLGFSTPAAKAWIRGGSPTSGFLGHSDTGPLRGLFRALAGVPLVDWLFMAGMLGVGVAVITGAGMRIAAVAGTVILMGMWAAEWPLAQLTASGAASGSTNPLIDYHIIYAVVLISLALLHAGRTWGLGQIWERTSLAKQQPWLV